MASGAVRGRRRRDRFPQLDPVLVARVVSTAVLAPWLAPFDAVGGHPRNASLRPGGRHLPGTDLHPRRARSTAVSSCDS
jgi:hypothetical protein